VSNMILIYNYIDSFMHLLYLWKANIRFWDLHFSRVIKICDVTELDMVWYCRKSVEPIEQNEFEWHGSKASCPWKR
jgi:hypothetical protein